MNNKNYSYSQNSKNFDNEIDNHSDNHKNGITKNEAKLIFDECRKFYKGTKRGLDIEFEDYLKKSKDWQQTIHLIKPAIEKEIAHREQLAANKVFVPEWKNFKTWINQRCWEQEFEPIRKNGTAKSQSTVTDEDKKNVYDLMFRKAKQWDEQ